MRSLRGNEFWNIVSATMKNGKAEGGSSASVLPAPIGPSAGWQSVRPNIGHSQPEVKTVLLFASKGHPEMNFLHKREYLKAGDIVVVHCSHESNVLLTDDINFGNYRARRAFRYHGGHYRMFPVRIVVPSSGYWNVTIDLGGGRANIRYDINFIKAAA
jgi:Domain of unknown function (DUF1883)